MIGNEQSTSILALALSSSLALVVVLGTILWYFIRDKMRIREKTEGKLDVRLAAGAQTMTDIRNEVGEVRSMQVQSMGTTMTVDKCAVKHQEHSHVHERLDKQVDRVVKAQDDIKLDLSRLDGKMDKGFGNMIDLLSKKITIGNADDS